MADISLSISDFPSLEGRQRVTWAPVFLCPITGSPERLVVAIAVAGKKSGLVCKASAIERIRCLYGAAADLIIASADSALAELSMRISSEGEKFLLAESFGVGPVYLGTPLQSTAKEMRSLAIMWLNSISSLQEFRTELSLVQTSPQKVVEPRKRGDRLPVEVFKVASDRKSPILRYFTRSLQRNSSRKPLANVSLDFEGSRTVANFGKLRPMPNMRAEFDRILGRLWALDVNQVRAGHAESDAVSYELILQRPTLSDFSDGGKKVSRALDELAEQADEKNLGFRQFASVTDMLDHLEKREAA